MPLLGGSVFHLQEGVPCCLPGWFYDEADATTAVETGPGAIRLVRGRVTGRLCDVFLTGRTK
jgi:hypothetical protein